MTAHPYAFEDTVGIDTGNGNIFGTLIIPDEHGVRPYLPMAAAAAGTIRVINRSLKLSNASAWPPS